MAIVDKKKKVFGKIAAAKTLTQGLPKLKLSSSFPSINNGGDSISFLTDLIKSLIGYEALVSAVVDTLTHSIPKIEHEIKKALKVELKTIVSCGVDPHLPTWIQSIGSGIVIEVHKIDFMDVLRTDPNSVGGKLLYNDITTPLTNSSDFNTFLYGVIQDDGNTYTWRNIFDITFNSLGTGGNPNNTLTIKANSTYDSKTLTDINNDFIDSLTLLSTENIVNKIMDVIYGSISSTIGKSLKQLESEAQINGIVDKMVNNVNKNPINDSAFSFTKEETYSQQIEAINRKKGVAALNVSSVVPSSVPINSLTNFNTDMAVASTLIQKKDALTNNLNKMANLSALNVPSKIDIPTVKLNFIQQIISSMIKSIVNIFLSPKVIFSFIINYKIVYGPTATFTDGVDFIKKNKNLMNSVMKVIAQELIKILLSIALKEISSLVAEAIAKRQKEKSVNKLAQLQSLIGIPTDIIKKILENLI
ncbi:MAG: hypothetical protein WCK82_00560 [Bacteroidota bacterium]|jgi:hypothetical protein